MIRQKASEGTWRMCKGDCCAFARIVKDSSHSALIYSNAAYFNFNCDQIIGWCFFFYAGTVLQPLCAGLLDVLFLLQYMRHHLSCDLPNCFSISIITTAMTLFCVLVFTCNRFV